MDFLSVQAQAAAYKGQMKERERRTDELFRRLQGVEEVRVELDAAARDRRRLTS